MVANIPIMPVWKPVGYSTHIIASNLARMLGVKTSHTGTLDPMAKGVIIVLVEEERLKKYEYAHWQKEYEFDVVLGIETDTFDGLGVPAVVGSRQELNEQRVFDICRSFIGNYTQQAPPYSAKRVLGKPLHWYARNNRLNEITLPKINGEIFDLAFFKTRRLTLTQIISKLSSDIHKTTGDLRQDEILSHWNELSVSETSGNRISHFDVLSFSAKVSKGIYIRGLALDIARRLSTTGFVLDLTRTRNGVYDRNMCLTLEQVFGSDFLEKFDFVSSQSV